MKDNPGADSVLLQVIFLLNSVFTCFQNGEFFFDNPATIATQGFTIDPQRGMVEAGALKPVTVTWTPPKGHDVSRLIAGWMGG